MVGFIEGTLKGRIGSALTRWWRSEGPFSRQELGAKTRVKLAGLKLLDLAGVPFKPEGSRLEVKRVELLGEKRAISPFLRAVLEDYELVPYETYSYQKEDLEKEHYLAWVRGKGEGLEEKIGRLAKAIKYRDYAVSDLSRDLHKLLLLFPHGDFSFAARHILELLCQRDSVSSLILGELRKVVSEPLLYPSREGYFGTVWKTAVEVLVRVDQKNAISPLMRGSERLRRVKADERLAVAVDALGRLWDRQATNLLVDLLRDPTVGAMLKAEVADALGLIRSQNGVGPLIALFQRLSLVPEKYHRFWLAREILFALHHIGGKTALAFIQKVEFDRLLFDEHHRKALEQQKEMLANFPQGLFYGKNRERGWFRFDPAISLLIRKINALYFVRSTIMCCSGHLPEPGGAGGLEAQGRPFLVIGYYVEKEFADGVKMLHESLLQLGFRVQPPDGRALNLLDRRGPSIQNPQINYYLDVSDSPTYAEDLLGAWSKVEAMVDRYLGLNLG